MEYLDGLKPFPENFFHLEDWQLLFAATLSVIFLGHYIVTFFIIVIYIYNHLS